MKPSYYSITTPTSVLGIEVQQVGRNQVVTWSTPFLPLLGRSLFTVRCLVAKNGWRIEEVTDTTP